MNVKTVKMCRVAGGMDRLLPRLPGVARGSDGEDWVMCPGTRVCVYVSVCTQVQAHVCMHTCLMTEKPGLILISPACSVTPYGFCSADEPWLIEGDTKCQCSEMAAHVEKGWRVKELSPGAHGSGGEFREAQLLGELVSHVRPENLLFFSRPVVPDSLHPHGLHPPAPRPPCLSPSPAVCSSSCSFHL